MPKITLENGVTTYYELHGDHDKTVVLVSGLKADHTAWLPVLERFSGEYRVLIFDNLGSGQADAPDREYTVEEMAENTMQLIRELDIEAPHVVGHSLGGAVTQVIARKYGGEVASITLANTFPKFDQRSSQVFLDVLPLHKQGIKASEILKSFLHEVFSEAFLKQEGIVDFIMKATDEAPNPQTYAGYKGQLSALIQFDSQPWLGEINVPALVLHASEDTVVSDKNAEDLHVGIEGSDFKTIPGGHASQAESADLFFNAVNQFLKVDCAKKLSR